MSTNAANVYCSIDDVADILSRIGITLAVDDDPPSEYGAVIARAGNQIDKYCFKRYLPDELVKSDLVKDWAAILAAYYLRTRRGNPCPQGLKPLYDETIDDLTEIKTGVNEIPGIVPRKSYVPVLCILKPTLRPYPRVVVERSRGSSATGTAENYTQKNNDPYDRFGWNTAGFLDYSF